LQEELEQELVHAQELLHKVELKTYFTDEHDDAPALVSFAAGAGGIDAMDWTERLMRMYIRFAELKEWKAEVLDISQGEEAGIKSATLRIEGQYAYGMLKGEAGVHRLVRISPFDSEGMRHTSFAAVEVIPELTDVSEDAIKIDPDDLRIDTFLSSGKGGQSVNTTYSAVRITHIPTSTVVSCQNERSQQQNRDTAMSVLKSRLYQLLLTERKEKIEELRGVRKSIEWGSQIRSYVMQPYRLVKDHRTNVETSDIDSVMDGNIGTFIEGYLLDQAKK
jgi:peptide chain release factor 2